MTNIILSILTVLLMLFPNCTRLQVEYRTRIFSRDFKAANLVRIINERDIDALEELMCGNIKQNTSDLSGMFENLFDAIDGKIVEFSWEVSGGYEANHGNGKRLSQQHYRLDFSTSTGSYRIRGIYEYYNSFQPVEIGIRSLTLFDPPESLNMTVQIRATNGVGEWHE